MAIDNKELREQLVELLVSSHAGKIHLSSAWPEIPMDTRPVSRQLLGISATESNDSRTGDTLCGQIVDHPHEADADDADAYHCRKSFSNNRLEISMNFRIFMGCG